MNTLTFNRKNFEDFATFWDGSKLFDSPEKDVEFYSVPGRNGDLSISRERYKNKNITIPCFIKENFKGNFEGLSNFLLAQEGYGRLENSEEPDVYRMAQFVDAIQPATGPFNYSGSFSLVFNCMPQKWLKIGEKGFEVASGKSLVLNNPTLQIAKPLIAVTGTGSFDVGEYPVTVNTNNSTVYIDCEIEDAYEEGPVNRNRDILIPDGFPRLTTGANVISTSGCSIILYPRWYRL